ncbi:GDSL esterase/lipase EXL3-like [Typha latifolia]|uniref:GDSL esterase/lipase EXL3-like n=1 Tax=Typha latifolia TaxID=4733 RepID=UPI003C2ECD3D
MGSKCLVRAAFTALSLMIFLLEIHQVLSKPSNRTVPPAIIVFGDSIVDPGNNNAIDTMIKCNFPPYGKDFAGHKATGRFSNGKVPGDMIASQLGVKEYVPAYLGTQLDDKDLLTGVSFASGACGYDPLTAQLMSVLTLDDQLNMFEEYKKKLKTIAGEKTAAHIISKSMYIVMTGTDDLANTYFTTPFRRVEYDLASYIKFVVQSASSFFQKLYRSGARKIGVVGVPPIGCLPSQRTNAGGLERECVTSYNQAAIVLNSELSKEIERLNHTLSGSKIVYIDMYTPFLDLIQRPSSYGFEVTSRGCCGTGIFEVTLTCNSITAPPCEDVSKYVFWDTYHPTERAYDILIRKLMQRYGSALN